ncbi:MAG: hypothetical protein H6618_10455, partial [Deltaproteobacteria bacterium]|nr:hypothetical protein [Deltaproteobacteria bacterium]
MTGFMILPLQHVFRLLTLLSCQLLPLLLAGTVLPQHVEAKQFTKATEDEDEVVKNKLFPKRKKIELNGPDIGIILNQSYVASYVFHAGIIYYQSEKWG